MSRIRPILSNKFGLKHSGAKIKKTVQITAFLHVFNTNIVRCIAAIP